VSKAFGLSCSLFLISLGAHATTVRPLDVDQLMQLAPIVVYGKVVQIEVSSETGLRTAVIEAMEVPKGPADIRERRDFHVPLFNRAIPRSDLIERVPSAPELQVLEEVVLFLEPRPRAEKGLFFRTDQRDLYYIQGLYQGKMRVLSDRLGRRHVAAWSQVPDKIMTDRELRKQRTTPRAALSETQVSLRTATVQVETLPTLYSLLNQARTVGARGDE